MARQYRRDARGRFAGGGYSGQTGGRGARLTSKGSRQGGGAKVTATAAPGRARIARGGERPGRGRRGQAAPAPVTASPRQAAGRLSTGAIPTGTMRRPNGRGGMPLADPQQVRLQLAKNTRRQFQRAGRMAEPLTSDRGGTLNARSSLTRSRRKLAANDTPSQRGAVTRANRYARAAQARDRTTIAGARPSSTVAKRPRKQGPANSIRDIDLPSRMGRVMNQSPKQFLAQEERNARRYGKPGRASARPKPVGKPGETSSNIRPYEPATPGGLNAAVKRHSARKRAGEPPANRIIREPITRRGRQAKANYLRGRMAGLQGDIRDEVRDLKQGLGRIKKAGDALTRKWAMRTARDIADSGRKDTRGWVARTSLERAPYQERRMAQAIIRQRAQRAAAAAARGSKPAARAGGIYDRQLVPVIPKRKGSGKNSIKPGPRNTKGTPKRRRKRKG